MNKNNKHKLVPRFRFPEFENDNEWKSSTLDTLCEVITKGTTPTTLGYNYTEKGINFIKIESIQNSRINLAKVAFISNECNEVLKRSQLKENDILFSIAGALGIVAPVSAKELPANTNQALSILRLKEDQNKDYVLAYLGSDHISTEISKIKAGAAQPNISLGQISNFDILIPKAPKEQQKIAACLSSLDEVLSAERQKLEVLKEHKKGLLQNLFPQEGEVVPKFRFKEFVGSGEWVETTLGEIGEPLMCKRIFKEETSPNPKHGIPFYKIGTFGRVADSYIKIEVYLEYKSKYPFPKAGDILISASGTIGRLVVYNGSPAYFQDSNIIWLGHNEEKILNKFLLQCYTSMRWQTSDGGVISRLYNSDFKRMKIKFPEDPKEQEKIASTLSSIDDLINAQNQKIEALQLHKKGLLQGLFPSINETKA